MPTHRFKIKHGDTTTGDLNINDRGDAEAREKYIIIWKIKPGSNVASITSIDLKTQPNSTLFSSLDPTDPPQNQEWRGVIKPKASEGEYPYSISWLCIDGTGPHKYDPKIAVLSSTFSFTKLVAQVLFVFLGIFGLFRMFLRKKKNS
jgi:hypothetical protein